MAASKAQTATDSRTGTTNLSLVDASNTTTGNTVVVGVIENRTTEGVTAVTATGMSFTKITSASGTIGGDALSYVSVWYAYNITTATTPTITVDKGGSSFSAQGIAWEITGVTTTDPLDKVAMAGGAATTAVDSGNTASTTQADEYLLGIGASDFGGTSYTLGTNYANLVTKTAAAGDIGMEDRSVSSTGTYKATFTLGDATDNLGVILTFLVASTSLSINVSETVTTSESKTLTLVWQGSVNDTATLSETVTLIGPSNPNVGDTATTSESKTVAILDNITVRDTSTTSESVGYYSDTVFTLEHISISAPYIPSTTSIKTWNGVVRASIKTWNSVADALVKTWDGLQ